MSRATRAALATCDACPVRQQCRDDMLELRPVGPVQVIAGGWRWDARGHPTPHPAGAGRAAELILAAAARVAARGLPWPYQRAGSSYALSLAGSKA